MKKDKLQSIADVARIAGVSKSTVSRALNDSPLIGEATKDRIRAIAREHDFRPNIPARRLSLRSSRTVAFVTHLCYPDAFSVADLFGVEIMGGLARGLFELQYDMLLVQVDPKDTEWVAQYLDTGRVDGFVLMTTVRKNRHIEQLLKLRAPFVAWGRGNGRYCTVRGDDRTGGRLATRHLLSTGRSRVAFIGGPPIEPEVKERYQGYVDALSEAGTELDPELVAYGDYSERSGAAAMSELLFRDKGIDAVFVNSDLMALAAMEQLRRQGLRVPEDVAVVGYDNLSIAERSAPALTTVSQNIPLAGRILARDLAAYLENKVVTETVIPVELVKRDSG